MTRPKPKKLPVALAPHTDPSHPEYISPREERRLRRELLQRIDHLFIIADAKGYGPIIRMRQEDNRRPHPSSE